MNAPMNGQWKGHVLLVRMNYDPKTAWQVTDAADAACFELSEAGYLVTPTKKLGTADIGDNRNAVVSQFYVRTEYTHLILYDQDISWELGTVLRLVTHPVDLVLGIYLKRVVGGGFALRTLPGPIEPVDPLTGQYKADGLIKIAGGPGGMMCLTRACVEKMVSAYSKRWYASPHVTGGKVWSLFEFEIHDNERISEDMNFCRMWRELGHAVWADPHIKLHHHGDMAFSGRLIDHLRETDRLIDHDKIAKIPLDASA